jgi:hypothetical protein
MRTGKVRHTNAGSHEMSNMSMCFGRFTYLRAAFALEQSIGDAANACNCL